MKKSNISTEKPAAKANAEQALGAVAVEAKPKKSSATQKATKAALPTKIASKAIVEKEVATVAAKPKPENPKPPKKVSVKPKAVTAKPIASAIELPMPERVGLTAGSIWGYLSENGPSSVTKLVRELPEEEKIIQRSIGWLAQEGKITLDTINKIETISLND